MSYVDGTACDILFCGWHCTEEYDLCLCVGTVIVRARGHSDMIRNDQMTSRTVNGVPGTSSVVFTMTARRSTST